MEIKLIAIDLDGTLLNEYKQLTDENKKALEAAKAKGIKIVLCSGRPRVGIDEVIHDLGIFSEDEFIIAVNGATIETVDGSHAIANHLITHQELNEWYTIAETNAITLVAETNERVYAFDAIIPKTAMIESYFCGLILEYRKFSAMDTQNMYTKLLCTLPNTMSNEDFLEILPHNIKEHFTIVQAFDQQFEIINKSASKGKSLQELATYLNIDAHNVMAIGDQLNDLDMIKFAKYGIAMGNAEAEVKAIAYDITDTNNNSGVAQAITKYCL